MGCNALWLIIVFTYLLNTIQCNEFAKTRKRKWIILQGPGCKSQLKNMDLMFMMDSSGSINHKNYIQMKGWIKKMVENFDITPGATQVGVVQYSHYISSRPPDEQPQIKTVIKLGAITSQAAFNTALDDVKKYGYGTFTAHALNKTVKDFLASKRQTSKKVLLLLTDGQSNDKSKLSASAKHVRSQSIVPVAVGVGGARKHELQIVATGTDTNKNVFFVKHFQDLKKINVAVRNAVCQAAGVPVPEVTEAANTTTVKILGAGNTTTVKVAGNSSTVIPLSPSNTTSDTSGSSKKGGGGGDGGNGKETEEEISDGYLTWIVLAAVIATLILLGIIAYSRYSKNKESKGDNPEYSALFNSNDQYQEDDFSSAGGDYYAGDDDLTYSVARESTA